jgi:hypothetical protein
MAIILAPSLAFLALGVAGMHVSREHRFKEVTTADRRQVVTGGELGVAIDVKREVLTKTEEDDGSLRLTYRYPQELMPGDPVSLECIVVRALDAAAAQRALELVEWETRKSLDPKAGLLEWGDASRAGTVLKDGRPVGSFFAARKDRFLLVLRVTGLQLDAEQLRAHLMPHLEPLTRFGEP